MWLSRRRLTTEAPTDTEFLSTGGDKEWEVEEMYISITYHISSHGYEPFSNPFYIFLLFVTLKPLVS